MVAAVNPKSVRFRTTVGAALALAALFIAAGVAVNWLVGRQIQDSFDATLLEQARDRATLLANGAPPESLMTVVGHEVIVVALSPDGGVLAAKGTSQPDRLAQLAPGVGDLRVQIVEEGEEGEDELHRETLRVAVAEAPDGSRIVVGNEGESARDTQSQVRNILLAGVPIVTLLGAIVAWFVTGRALRPVGVMQTDLDDVVHAGDGRRVRQPGSGDEIDELAITINDVLDRLDAQSLARRRFVADASHELKSPLANARVLLDTATDDELIDATATRQAVGRELDRLQALVEDLLYLARVDETAAHNPEQLDLDDIVFDEAERVAARSPKAIDASGVEPATVFADPREVARAIRNLVENAERFAVERVAIAIERTERDARVLIDDDGPGIPADERDRVFERFARLATDRARSDGGTGLGLAIVASIAERNDGSVTVSDSPLGGARFEVRFPAAK